MEGRIFLPLLFGLYLLNGQGTFAASPSPPATSTDTTTTVTTTPDASTTVTSDATSTEESSTATPATSTIDVTTPTTIKPTPAATSPSPATTTELVTTPSSPTSVTAGQGATQPTPTTAGPTETDTTKTNDTAADKSTATPTNTTSASSETPSAGNSNSAVTSTEPLTTGNSNSAVTSTEPLTTGTSTVTVYSTVPPTTGDFCSIGPCVTDAATCINIKRGRVCRCPFGYYYNSDTKMCSQGKQFFGTVNLNKTYSMAVVEPGSAEYKELYQEVQDFFVKCFENQTDYEQTIITKISRSSNSKRFRKAASDTVIEVNNIFLINTTITEDNVDKAIQTSLMADPLVSNYTISNPCNSSYCDEATTHCELLQSGTIVNCTCKNGFYKKTPELTTCKDCAPDCSKTNFKECVQINGESGLFPSCQCLADYQFNKEKKTCVPCDFGYSGKDCKDDFLLILVIVGVVLGALLLGLLGAVIGLSVKSKRNSKTPDRERLIDHEENPVFGSGTSTNGSLFPKVRAKPTVNANVATMNPYTSDETFQRSVPTRDYDDDNDSWYEMSQKDNRFGNQSKY
ncbi:mucin-13 [Lissotriton helveticus]